MILFKPQHVAPILEGKKTQTRRRGHKRWNVGAVHLCRTRLFDPSTTFARVRILEVRRERLGDITPADARAEGASDRREFFDGWERINKRTDLGEIIWVVQFELEESMPEVK